MSSLAAVPETSAVRPSKGSAASPERRLCRRLGRGSTVGSSSPDAAGEELQLRHVAATGAGVNLLVPHSTEDNPT